MQQILHFPQRFQGSPQPPPPPVPMEKGHFFGSVTTTTPWPAFDYLPSCGNGVAVFLQATKGELLPTFSKGSSILFPTEKGDIYYNM